MDLQPFLDTALDDRAALVVGRPVRHRGFIWFRRVDLERFLREAPTPRQLRAAGFVHDRLRVGTKIYNIWRTGAPPPALIDEVALQGYLKNRVDLFTDDLIKHLNLEPGLPVAELYTQLERRGWESCRLERRSAWRKP